MNPKLTPGNAIILGAGLVMVLGSFLPFYTVLGVTFSAWSTGNFGIVTVVVFCGAFMGGQVAVATWGSRTLSPRPFGLTWDQVHLALGFQATVMMLAHLARRHSSYVRYGAGFWMMLAAALALFAGALLRLRRRGLRAI